MDSLSKEWVSMSRVEEGPESRAKSPVTAGSILKSTAAFMPVSASLT